MPISASYIDGLTRQIFIRDYIANGLFPCQSDVVRSIRSKKIEWAFNDQFEYRMFLSNTNSGGTLNSQIYNKDVSLLNPGVTDFGIFRASYGNITDGFSVDLTKNLETEKSEAAFVSDYAQQVQSLRWNVAGLFKNFAIHGKFGALHRITAQDAAVANAANAPTPTTPGGQFTLRVPPNVMASTFKKGRLLIKTIADTTLGCPPWGPANCNELYVIVDNQAGRLTLQAVAGTSVSTNGWVAGEWLEVYGNRMVDAGSGTAGPVPNLAPGVWAAQGGWTTTGGVTNYTGIFNAPTGRVYNVAVPGQPQANGAVGAPEGLADLFPWYTSVISGKYNNNARLGLDLGFRGQPNRNYYTAEMAGAFYAMQMASDGSCSETILDAILQGVDITMQNVPYADVAMWINPYTQQAIGYQENENMRLLKDLAVSQPIIYDKGVTSFTMHIGSKTISNIIMDFNLPTDVVIIGPKDNISYNCWDNAFFHIDEYIKEMWSRSAPEKLEDIPVPNEFATRLDFAQRITYGAPTLSDGTLSSGRDYGAFVHPSNQLPIAFHEMGALFTENPYAYTVVKLKQPLLSPKSVESWADPDPAFAV